MNEGPRLARGGAAEVAERPGSFPDDLLEPPHLSDDIKQALAEEFSEILASRRKDERVQRVLAEQTQQRLDALVAYVARLRAL